jgi:hypothetical protein
MKTVVSLYDLTGNMVLPWVEAGYTAYIVDMQHPRGHTRYAPNIIKVGMDIRKGISLPGIHPSFVSAFPPCDHLAVSGARWFKGKGLRALSLSVDLFATAAEYCEEQEAPYVIENPVSTISTYWRKPDFTFNPYDYTGFDANDNYTKKTCLWTGGGFIMPPKNPAEGLPAPDDRIHKCAPGPERHNIRSATPMGFAKAVFEYNAQEGFL